MIEDDNDPLENFGALETSIAYQNESFNLMVDISDEDQNMIKGRVNYETGLTIGIVIWIECIVGNENFIYSTIRYFSDEDFSLKELTLNRSSDNGNQPEFGAICTPSMAFSDLVGGGISKIYFSSE